MSPEVKKSTKVDITVPTAWPEHYKQDFIANRTHGVDNLRDNEKVENGKVVIKRFKSRVVSNEKCPACAQETYHLEPGINAHHCPKCGYWDEVELKAFNDKFKKVIE